MRTKLNSEKGAALSYALLCFLVCAVVGSMILTAATAATGRFAGLAEADSRYFAVSSAARLLEDSFEDKKTVVIELEKKYKQEEKSKGSAAASEETSSEPTDISYAIKKILSDEMDSIDPVEATLSDGDLNLFQYAAYQYIIGSNIQAAVNEVIWNKPAYERDGFAGCQTIPTMRLSFNADGMKERKLKLETELEKDGMLTLRVSNDKEENQENENPDKDSFTLRMTMAPDVVLAENTNVESVSSTVDKTSAETVEKTITETKTYTVIWRVLKIDIERGHSTT